MPQLIIPTVCAIFGIVILLLIGVLIDVKHEIKIYKGFYEKLKKEHLEIVDKFYDVDIVEDDDGCFEVKLTLKKEYQNVKI
jgi:hypothetical protein